MTMKENKTTGIMIRETTSDDFDEVLALYPQAFPDEELRPIVSALLDGEHETLSLAAFGDDKLVAHVLFTFCGMQVDDRNRALLAPLGVIPSHQGLGFGTLIVRAGIARLEKSEIGQLFVLGDPAYYSRFCFVTEHNVLAPYHIPEEWANAWQSLQLSTGAPAAQGRLLLPEPWMQPVLWGP
ncbi:MAG: N-acetyltransferase [Paracoccaceae bacterium]